MHRFAPLALIALLGACDTMDGSFGGGPRGPGPFPNGPPPGVYDPAEGPGLGVGAPPPPPYDRGDPDDRLDALPYHASGTEPFWSLDLDLETMRFSDPDRREPIEEPTPRVIHGFAGEIYPGRRINVNIVHGACNDGMSDRSYPDKVEVTVDGRHFEGCGGLPPGPGGDDGGMPPGPGDDNGGPPPPPVASSPLAGSIWRVVAINGRPTPDEPRYRMEFTGTRVSAGFGCNAMGGPYALDRDMLSIGPVMGTKMACGDPAQTFESQGSAVLNVPARARFAPGRLTLTNRAGTIELERR